MDRYKGEGIGVIPLLVVWKAVKELVTTSGKSYTIKRTVETKFHVQWPEGYQDFLLFFTQFYYLWGIKNLSAVFVVWNSLNLWCKKMTSMLKDVCFKFLN